jgi:hypothetical protein
MYVGKEQQDVLRAASMYYLQDLKMEVIAKHSARRARRCPG